MRMCLRSLVRSFLSDATEHSTFNVECQVHWISLFMGFKIAKACLAGLILVIVHEYSCHIVLGCYWRCLCHLRSSFNPILLAVALMYSVFCRMSWCLLHE